MVPMQFITPATLLLLWCPSQIGLLQVAPACSTQPPAADWSSMICYVRRHARVHLHCTGYSWRWMCKYLWRVDAQAAQQCTYVYSDTAYLCECNHKCHKLVQHAVDQEQPHHAHHAEVSILQQEQRPCMAVEH